MICDAPTGADGSWSEDGTILFDGAQQRPDHAGRRRRRRRRPNSSATSKSTVGWPQFLPGGKRFLYVDITEGKQGFRIADARRQERAARWSSGLSRVEYAPPGYLLFVRDATLVAQRFDAGRAS